LSRFPIITRAKWADEWFDDLERLVHPIIDRNRKDRQKPVRVAILDTGVDARHPELKKAMQAHRIGGYRGFPDSLDPLADRNGHGTHGASVFMRTAPRASIYLGRVADDDGNIAADNGYAVVVKVPSLRSNE
jgi:Subtilase family